MIDISFLYGGFTSDAAAHRYGHVLSQRENQDSFELPSSARRRKPIVVWNITRTCNLKCVHCYSNSELRRYSGELSTSQARTVIEDLADFKVPAVLFSGGEPLARPDLFELAAYAKEKRVRAVLSTNGTLINRTIADRIKSAGFSYVGVSLDGLEEVHDYFRGVNGAFKQTLSGIRALADVGQKTGLRLTLTEHTIGQIEALFDLIRKEKIQRVCFYHLVPSGRGKYLYQISPEKVRTGIDLIIEKTKEIIEQGFPLEVLTVDNHADGPYLFLKLKKTGNARAQKVYEFLKWNGGGLYSTGVGVAAIDWEGSVHPDQFWGHYSLGNVREKKFSEIWEDSKEPLLWKLRNRRDFIYGRCRDCRFFELCGGALRVRAELTVGDPWAPDPACYLTDEEIGASTCAEVMGE